MVDAQEKYLRSEFAVLVFEYGVELLTSVSFKLVMGAFSSNHNLIQETVNSLDNEEVITYTKYVNVLSVKLLQRLQQIAKEKT